jgi:hypothetical protein
MDFKSLDGLRFPLQGLLSIPSVRPDMVLLLYRSWRSSRLSLIGCMKDISAHEDEQAI